MRFWQRTLLDLCREGLFGWATAGLPLVALFAWLLLPYAWRRGGDARPRPVLAACALLLFGDLAAVAVTRNAHDHLARLALGTEDGPMFATLRHFGLCLQAPFVAAISTLFAVAPLTGILHSRGRRRDDPPSHARFSASVVLAAAGAMIGSSALAICGLCESGYQSIGDIESADSRMRARYELFVASFGVTEIHRGRAAVLAIAAITALVVLVKATRRSSAGPRADAPIVPLWPSAVLFLIGAVAWTLTRAEAYDAEHPLPFSDEYSGVLSTELPAGEHCAPPTDAPLAEMTSGGVIINGLAVATPVDAGKRFAALRELSVAVHPGRTFPGAVLFAASPRTSTREVLPFLTAARESGFTRVEALLALPREQIATQTLGVVNDAPRQCSVVVAGEGMGAGAEGTWGEWVGQRPEANAQGPLTDPSDAGSPACAALARDIAAKLRDSEPRAGHDASDACALTPPDVSCVTTPRGVTWGYRLISATAKNQGPDDESFDAVKCETEEDLELVRVVSDRTLVVPGESLHLHYDVFTHHNSVQLVALMDFDGDGEVEILRTRKQMDREGDPETKVDVFTYANGALAPYAPANSIPILQAEDIDGDGRPDLLSAGPFSGLTAATGMPATWPIAPAIFAFHSLPDGSFSATDGASLAFTRKACPTKPVVKLGPNDFGFPDADLVQTLVCARLWGESNAIEAAWNKACAAKVAEAGDVGGGYECQSWALSLAKTVVPFSFP